jgi:hypothetical protein
MHPTPAIADRGSRPTAAAFRRQTPATALMAEVFEREHQHAEVVRG